jgi:hypothetical protein
VHSPPGYAPAVGAAATVTPNPKVKAAAVLTSAAAKRRAVTDVLIKIKNPLRSKHNSARQKVGHHVRDEDVFERVVRLGVPVKLGFGQVADVVEGHCCLTGRVVGDEQSRVGLDWIVIGLGAWHNAPVSRAPPTLATSHAAVRARYKIQLEQVNDLHRRW